MIKTECKIKVGDTRDTMTLSMEVE